MENIESESPYISIIVPIYNVESYLEKCLNSILNQNFRNFECILINDGSTDNSGKICDEFALLDTRIIVIHKDNGGVVSARKAGLQKASGKFIGCVDPDDWIEKDYFENFVTMQKKSNADIVAGNLFRDIGTESFPVRNKIPAGLYCTRDILPQLIYSGTFFEFGLHSSLCTKLIRKEIMDSVQMKLNEDISYEDDGAVVYPGVLEAETILITDICGYHYVQRQGSITKTVAPDDLKKLYLVFEHLENAFREKGVLSELKPQINQWKKFIFLERQIQVFDKETGSKKILTPYGGILPHTRIVIYGASFMGQTIDRYITSVGESVAKRVLWIDKEYKNFVRQGLAVNPPEDIKNLDDEFDVVLIASVTESIVHSMKDYLIGLNVPEHKILWLSEQFISGDDMI